MAYFNSRKSLNQSHIYINCHSLLKYLQWVNENVNGNMEPS